LNQSTYIIIVTFNGLPWIRKCFDSIKDSNLLQQTIVIDNASTDSTVEDIRRTYPEVDITLEPNNLGFGKANNIGIAKAIQKGATHLFLLNQDAYLQKNTVSKLINLSNNNPEYGILSPIHLNENGKTDYLFQSYLTDAKIDPNSNNEIEEVNFCNAALWLVPASTFLIIGGFDPVFPHYGEDKDLVNRLKYHQLKIGVCTNVTSTHDRDSSAPLPFEKRKYFEYISYLVDLKNPNSVFHEAYLAAIKKINKYLIYEALKFQIRGFKLDLKHKKELKLNLTDIKNHRELCLSKGAHFLKLE
jgi:GT2 family glycosyltransferase